MNEYFFRFINTLPARQHNANAAAWTATIATESTAEHTVTDLKLLNNLIEESAGKITSTEISREPTSKNGNRTEQGTAYIPVLYAVPAT